MNLGFSTQLKAAKIPGPVSEYRFKPPRRWRFDLAWPKHMVALEIEGGVWKYGRHNRPTGFLRDCEKYNEAACLGWRVIRVTHEQLKDGTAIRYLERLLTSGDTITPVDGSNSAAGNGSRFRRSR